MKTKITAVNDQKFENVYRIRTDSDIEVLDVHVFGPLGKIPKVGDSIEYSFQTKNESNSGCTMNGKVLKHSKDSTVVSFGGYMGVFRDQGEYKEGDNFSIWFSI